MKRDDAIGRAALETTSPSGVAADVMTTRPVLPDEIPHEHPEPAHALTILHHGDLGRVGHVVRLLGLAAGGTFQLSRNAPVFMDPAGTVAGPLGDPCLSRQPFLLQGLPGGGVRVSRNDSPTVIEHRGKAFTSRDFSREEVERGVVLQLGRRVVLLLHWKSPPAAVEDVAGVLGPSDAAQELRRRIRQVADVDVPVLVRGEPGTGKEVVARAIHAASARSKGPFVAINLGAVTQSSAPAELLGEEGPFHLAEGGTLFVEDLDDAAPAVLAPLLRVLDKREIPPVSGRAPRRTDVRIIVAAGPLSADAAPESGMRARLIERLSGYLVNVPPLRERREDVASLVLSFCKEELAAIRRTERLTADWLTAGVVAQLADHPWPGNVRQLRNVVRQLVIGNRESDRVRIGQTVKIMLFPAESPPRPSQPLVPVTVGGDPPHPPAPPAPPRAPPQLVSLELQRIDGAGGTFDSCEGPHRYSLRTGPAAYWGVRVDWNAELRAALAALCAPDHDPSIRQSVGDLLRGALEGSAWVDLAKKIDRPDREARVVVHLRSAAAELYALPWELLTMPSSRHLGDLPGVVIRYEWPDDGGGAGPVEPAAAGGRILLAWSNGCGPAQVPSKDHVEAIRRAAERGDHAFDPRADVLAGASYGRISDALQAAARDGRSIAVLHLLCHGAADGETFGLVLDGDDGKRAVIDADRMRALLAQHADRVRLVVLSACNGGNPGALGNHLGSVAQALHRAGVQAVVASRFPLSVAGSVRLTETLYDELLAGRRSLEEAFLRARAQLGRDPKHLDWASIQLYVRTREGDGGDTWPLGVRA